MNGLTTIYKKLRNNYIMFDERIYDVIGLLGDASTNKSNASSFSKISEE